MGDSIDRPANAGGPAGAAGPRAAVGLFALVVFLFAALMFHPLLRPGAILFGSDDNLGTMVERRSDMPESFFRGWHDRTFLGAPAPANPSWTNLLSWALPPRLVHNWVYTAHLALASVLLALFLRRRGVGPAGWLVGALAAFWLGSTFTLVYAGHLGKFGVVLCAALFLWRADIAVTARRGIAPRAILAGGALGAMFLEQSDVGLLFAVALGPFAIHRLYAVWGYDVREWVRRLAPLLAVALLVAFHPLWSGYGAFVRRSASQDDPRERWDFITQWSWPPEETVDFVAPGFMGWRSGEPEGPYWGRMGRSREWESARRGLMNFKLENQYLGALPLALALAAVALARRRGADGTAPEPRRGEIYFWAGLAAAALVLAFGKFTPLYSLVFRLPALSSVRAPVKWLQPFQLAVGILAAFAADRLWPWPAGATPARPPRRLAIGLLAAAAVLGLVALGLFAGRAAAAARLAAEGWGPAGAVIARNRAIAALHGAALAGLAGLLLWRRRTGAPLFSPRVCVLLVPALIAADALRLSRHYVKRLPPSLVAENEVTRVLKSELGPDRVALAAQGGFYGAWLTFLFPYHDIRALDFTQMPRMAEDVRAFLERVAPNPLRYWQLSGVRFVLAPPGAWTQWRQNADVRDLFALRLAFTPVPADDGEGLTVAPADPDDPNAHTLLRLLAPSARFALVTRWRTAEDAAALAALSDPAWTPLREALLAPGSARSDGAYEPDPRNAVVAVALRPGLTELRVVSATPALVRIADRYDPNWRATLNGTPVPVERADYLFQGVFVGPGEHRLRLEFRPSPVSLIVLAGGVLACALSALALAAERLRTGAGA